MDVFMYCLLLYVWTIIIIVKLVVHITEFNGLFQLFPFVFFKFYARIQYENSAHYLF